MAAHPRRYLAAERPEIGQGAAALRPWTRYKGRLVARDRTRRIDARTFRLTLKQTETDPRPSFLLFKLITRNGVRCRCRRYIIPILFFQVIDKCWCFVIGFFKNLIAYTKNVSKRIDKHDPVVKEKYAPAIGSVLKEITGESTLNQ